MSARYARTALTDPGVQAVRQGAHEFAQLRGVQRGPQCWVIGVRPREEQVAPDRVVEQVGGLAEERDTATKVGGPELAQIGAAQQHTSGVWISEAQGERGDGGFARTGRAEQCDATASRYLQRQGVQHGRAVAPAEMHAFESQSGLYWGAANTKRAR